jgi:hypothetical protein
MTSGHSVKFRIYMGCLVVEASTVRLGSLYTHTSVTEVLYCTAQALNDDAIPASCLA